jgi:anti-sigma factor RsiW
MGPLNLGRRFDKHIDDRELNALGSSPADSGGELSREAVRAAERHVESCASCGRKVSEYRQLVTRRNAAVWVAPDPGSHCPKNINWHEVAAGLWPELKTKQLIMHAALCNHCGPALRAATSVDDEATPQEEEVLAQLKVPSRPVDSELIQAVPKSPRLWQRSLQWKIPVPAVALMIIGGVLYAGLSSPTPLSGSKFAEFAVDTHRQYAQGNLALDLRSDSQQALNQWLKANSQFGLALPGSPAAPGEERPYRLEGARFVSVAGKTAAYLAYDMQTGPVSLVVTPDTVAVASGGVELDFQKVSFHYRMVSGYKVVTWSVHGLTYALVSQEGNRKQQSCMVCHSAMHDRDLSQTPTPLRAERSAIHPLWQ